MTTSTCAKDSHTCKRRIRADLAYFLRRPLATTRLMLGLSLPVDFRERIMLAVTQVNQCSLCSWAHTRFALRAGIPREEIHAILHAELRPVPAGQLAAVLFAQHWAYTQGQVDPETRKCLEESYDPATRADILLSIHFINAMNALMGAFQRKTPLSPPRESPHQ